MICTPPSTTPKSLCTFSRSTRRALREALRGRPRLRSRAGRGREATQTLLTMASKFRYVPDVIRAKSILASGILGEIILFDNVFASRAKMSNRWNSDPAISGGGVLIDNGTHSVDIIRYFLGPIAEVLAVEGKRVQTLAVEDTVQMFVRRRAARGHDRSVMEPRQGAGQLHRDLRLQRHGAGRLEGVEVSAGDQPDWVVFGSGYDKIGAMRAQVDNFCRALRGEEPLLITVEDAIASVAVVEQAYRSLNESRWVRVRDGDNARSPSGLPQQTAV